MLTCVTMLQAGKKTGWDRKSEQSGQAVYTHAKRDVRGGFFFTYIIGQEESQWFEA